MSFVALATCKILPEPDADLPLLAAALERAGVPARALAWDDDAVDWSEPRLIVLRSTWNYHLQAEAFLAWAHRQGERLQNPPSIVEWNHHKRYLRDLEAHGISVTPTLWFEQAFDRARPYDFAALFADRGWGDIVIKPAVSAGSYRTSRIKGPPFDREALAGLVERGDAMAQPYITSVETCGERAVVWIDGEITHAVRKSPRLSGDREVVSDRIPVADDERQLATATLALKSLLGSPLYARIDVVRDAEGRPMVSELELIEPTLFLEQCPAAMDRFTSAIARRFRARGAS